MPLTVTRRKSTGALTIVGTVAGTRVRRRAQSDDPKLAAEEAATLAADILRAAWHGERRGSRTFAGAVTSYLDAAPRSETTKALCRRLLLALGTARLSEIDQGTVARLRTRVLRPGALPATVSRRIIVPLRAVLRHAHRRGWCDAPVFEIPRQVEGRTLYLLPDEAERLITAAAPHVKPLLLFLLSTGARMSEAIELDWRDLDLRGARAIFWRTKTGKRRVAQLPPRLVAVLAAMPHHEGPVFRWETTPSPRGHATRINTYVDHGREGGGQIKTAWKGARRAGLNPDLTPHDCRHTWASWHYATNRDLIALKLEGGWSSVVLAERYAHLMPAGHEEAIQQFLGWHPCGTDRSRERATL